MSQIDLKNDSLPLIAFKGVKYFVQKNKVISSMQIFGIFMAFVFTGFRVSEDNLNKYREMTREIDERQGEDIEDQRVKTDIAYTNQQNTKGWFWSCDATCTRNQNEQIKWNTKFETIVSKQKKEISIQKGEHLGMFSSLAVGEIHEQFGSKFNENYDFAKNMTFQDIIRIFLRGEYDSLAEVLVEVIMHQIWNFSVGLIFVFFKFVFGVWWIINSFNPDWTVSLIAWVLCILAAGSVILSVLMCIFGGIATVTQVAQKAGGALQDEDGRPQNPTDQQREQNRKRKYNNRIYHHE